MIVYEWCPHDLKVIIMILNDDFEERNDDWMMMILNDFGKGQFSLNEWWMKEWSRERTILPKWMINGCLHQ